MSFFFFHHLARRFLTIIAPSIFSWPPRREESGVGVLWLFCCRYSRNSTGVKLLRHAADASARDFLPVWLQLHKARLLLYAPPGNGQGPAAAVLVRSLLFPEGTASL